MVSIPKISPNLLLGGLIIGALFFITKEVRGAGQDLARSLGEGVLSNIQLPTLPTLPSVQAPDFSGLFDFLKSQPAPQITVNVPQPITPQGQLALPPLQIIDPQAGGIQRDIDALRKQIEKLAPSVPIIVTEIPPIVDPTTGQRPQTARELLDIIARNKASQQLFGVGFLGQDQLGISQQLAKRLNIFGLQESQISALQKRRLQTIGQTQTLQNLFDTRQAESVNRFLSSFNVTDFSGLIFGAPQQASIIPKITQTLIQTPSITIAPDLMRSTDIRASEIEKARKFTCEQFGLNCDVGMA